MCSRCESDAEQNEHQHSKHISFVQTGGRVHLDLNHVCNASKQHVQTSGLFGLHAWQVLFRAVFCQVFIHQTHSACRDEKSLRLEKVLVLILQCGKHELQQQIVTGFFGIFVLTVLMRSQQETCADCHDNSEFYGSSTCELQNRADVKLLCGNIQILPFSPKQMSRSTETPLTYIHQWQLNILGLAKRRLHHVHKVYINKPNTGSGRCLLWRVNVSS